MLGSPHLRRKGIGEEPITMHVVLKTAELIIVRANLVCNRIDGMDGKISVTLTLPDDVERLFVARSATLAEPVIHRVFLRIDELTDLHTEEQRLPITLRDAKVTQQLRRYLPALVISFTDTVSDRLATVVITAEGHGPVSTLLGGVAPAVPGIPSPFLIPRPVTVELQFACRPMRSMDLVSRIGPVPVARLGIEMETIGLMDIVHGDDTAAHEVGGSPPPRLEVGKDMYITNMCAPQGGELAVHLAPRAPRLVGRQTLAIVFVHRIEVVVERQCRFHHRLTVGVVGTQQDRRLIGPSEGSQPVLDTGNDGLRHPLHIILIGIHGLTETDKEADMRITLDEGGDALARIVTQQRCDRPVTVLRLDAVMVGERLGDDDVVEHLYDLDAAASRLPREEVVHLLVLTERGTVNLHSERIILQAHEGGKRMAVPEIERVHLVVDEHVEVTRPQRLVIEPREVLRGVRILIDLMAGQVSRLLQADTRAAQHHAGVLGC